MAIDEAKLNQFMGRAVGDMGAGFSAVLVVIGDKLGLYKALAGGPATPPGWRSGPGPRSATSGSGSATRPPADT